MPACAGLFGRTGSSRGVHSSRAQQFTHSLLHLLLRELLRRLLEIFDSVESPAVLDDRNPKRIHFRIENVRPMRRRMHPLVLNRRWIRAGCDVFGNRTKMRARGCGPLRQLGFPGY